MEFIIIKNVDTTFWLLCLNVVLALASETNEGKGQPRCCFPQQMEGRLMLSSEFTATYFQNARFAVDYVKGRAIIRHPGKDNIFILQDLKTDIKYERLASGACLITDLLEEERLLRCVPAEARHPGFDLTGRASEVNDWLVQRGTDVLYISVLRTNCQPVLVKRYHTNATSSRDEVFSHVVDRIDQPQVLDPMTNDCVRPGQKCSAATGVRRSSCPFITLTLYTLLYLQII